MNLDGQATHCCMYRCFVGQELCSRPASARRPTSLRRPRWAGSTRPGRTHEEYEQYTTGRLLGRCGVVEAHQNDRHSSDSGPHFSLRTVARRRSCCRPTPARRSPQPQAKAPRHPSASLIDSVSLLPRSTGRSRPRPMAAAAATQLSVYKAARSIKRRESTVYNALRSVAEDAAFVAEVAALWPALPLVANLRCGLWYAPPRAFAATCYFKSTDGHAGNWSFSTARLNLHLALLAGERGGCIIVDSTRKGKRFPDSMSKTIPIWCCVLNRAIKRHRLRALNKENIVNYEVSAAVLNGDAQKTSCSSDWDGSVHLPAWILDTERNAIEERIEEWTDRFESCGADIHSLAVGLGKPLRPLWISQRTRIWLNEVPEHESWDFTPIILISASASDTVSTHRVSSEFSWNYIPGAGDDEESWARGLTPTLFWKHSYDLLDAGPDLCNQLVADIVERDRVYRSQRGEYSPQIAVKPLKTPDGPNCSDDHTAGMWPMNSNPCMSTIESQYFTNGSQLFWIGTSNLAVSSTLQVADALDGVDCILNCDSTSQLPSNLSEDSYLELPIVVGDIFLGPFVFSFMLNFVGFVMIMLLVFVGLKG